MSVLNAYYLPGDPTLSPYASITPVNTFRLVLAKYFDAQLPLLDDVALYSSYKAPYEFHAVDPSAVD